MKIKINSIILDAKAQPRTELNSEAIQDYADAMKAGAKFPPVIAFGTKTKCWLADGWHRVHAAKVARLTEIEADVRVGDLDDAILYSFGANATNGMRRTNEDKRHSVIRMLSYLKWQKASNREVGRYCGVSDVTVGYIRKQVLNFSTSETHIGKDGKEYPATVIHDPTIQVKEPYEDDIEDRDELLIDIPPKVKEIAPKAKPQFNRTNVQIDWAWWSWNPVTGCELNCEYCYARDIANRFYPEKFAPTFHAERLEAPANTNPIIGDCIGGRNVFVCSMADLFGAWVPNEWISAVMKQVESNPQWNFLFLTKNPRRYTSVLFPDNAWVGTTVDIQARAKPAEDAFAKINARVKWVSVEPMQEPIVFKNIQAFNWIVIGGRSRNSQLPEFQPEWSWVDHLYRQAADAHIPVYFKANLTVRPKDYPQK